MKTQINKGETKLKGECPVQNKAGKIISGPLEGDLRVIYSSFIKK